jgi:hypothetical protein
MKVILPVGAPYSLHESVLELLKASGCGDPRPSRYDSQSPRDLQAAVLKSHELDLASIPVMRTLEPGKLWSEMAVDLFMANIDQVVWGWADHQTGPLIDFWATFDPQVRFVICYESPSAYVAKALAHNEKPDEVEVEAALAEWMRWNVFLLERFKRHRQRCVLIESHAALYAPSKLTELLSAEWQLALEGAISAPREPAADLVGHLLADSFFSEAHPAWALLDQINGLAQIPASPRESREARLSRAWAGWIGVGTQLDELRRLPVLTRLGAELEAELVGSRESCEAARSLQAEAEMQVAELRAENDRLASQVQQLVAQVEASATQSRSAEFQQLLEQVGQVRERMDEERRTNIRAAELVLENEHLLAALHEVQEQLEKAVSTRVGASGVPQPIEVLVQTGSPQQEVEVDLCQSIHGENWYPAEEDGRWAGPGLHSSLKMPPLRSGAYALEMSLAGAIAPDIVYGLRIEAFGTDVPFEFSHAVTPGSFPIVCKGMVQIPIQAETQPWQLGLRFPRTVSPADSGSSDQRQLAIRVRGVQMKPTTANAMQDGFAGLAEQA